MAKLEITEEEFKANSYLGWDDDALGKACKRVATILRDNSGEGSLEVTGAAIFLIAVASDVGSEELSLVLHGIRQKEKQLGDWEVTVKKLNTECRPHESDITDQKQTNMTPEKRLRLEYDQLSSRIKKLKAFKEEKEWSFLPVVEQQDIEEQLLWMVKYRDVLARRLQRRET